VSALVVRSTMLIFTGAFPFEIAGIKKRGNFHPAGHGYFEGELGGSPAVLAVSGIGEERAYKTAKEILGLFPNARAYVSVGLSAALVPELSPGDIVAASEIVTAAAPFNTCPCDPELIDAVSKIKCRTGRFFAASKTVITASEKMEIARANGAIALDMESGGAARASIEAGIPFISIRAISDGLDEDLPVDFNLLMREGKMRWGRFIFYFMTHPAKIAPLMRLGRNSRLARERLGDAINLFSS
jgi:adenosylhomocysteine nucleosidase